jgi:predicted outer membrane repeat protein
LGDVGGAFYLEQTTFTDVNSILSYNSAILGGAFYCKTCAMTLGATQITNHKGLNGGAFYLLEQVTVTLNDFYA